MKHRHQWAWRKGAAGTYRWTCLRRHAFPDRRQLARIQARDAETQRIRNLRFGHEPGEQRRLL